MNTYQKVTIVILVVLALGITSSIAVAGTPPPVPTPKPCPTPVPPPSGGYTPPSYSAAPSFQPYTEDLKSSDGSTIGQLSGIDSSTVRLTASRNVTIDGDAFAIAVSADMNSKPVGATLDISMGDKGNVPGGMDNVVMLSTASMSAQSRYGWPIKSGTLAMKFTLPASRLSEASPDTKYYIVRYDGTGYQIIPGSVVTSNTTATIEAQVPDLSGTYTAVMSCPPKPAVVSSPTPLPALAATPIPAPCPTPAPAPTGIMGMLSSIWVSAFGTFAIGEVAGALILLTLGKFMR